MTTATVSNDDPVNLYNINIQLAHDMTTFLHYQAHNISYWVQYFMLWYCNIRIS